MKRRAFVALLACAAVVAHVAGAQERPKASRIGVLGFTKSDPVLTSHFEEALSEFGYRLPENLSIVALDADGRPERMAALAQELVRSDVELIFARGAAAVLAARTATTTIPIVAIDLESDPITSGFAKSLARPGGNVTGVFLDLPELSGKQLQLLREVAPRLSSVAILGDPVLNAAQLAATAAAARSLGIKATAQNLSAADDFDSAFAAARADGVDAVLVLSSPLVFVQRRHIADMAVTGKLPVVSMFVEFAEAGGLMAYGPSLRQSFRRCGVYVGRILRGERPEELPIERPEKFDLAVNVRTAKALGLTIPAPLLARADEVIE